MYHSQLIRLRGFITFLALIISISISTAFANDNEIINVAESFASHHFKQNTLVEVDTIVSYPDIQNPILFECRFKKQKGMVLISAHSGIFSVLGYSESIDWGKTMPDGYKQLIASYVEQIQEYIDRETHEFDFIMPGHRISKSKANGISPLLQTNWGQGCYYNELCPADNLSGSYFCHHVPTGCVATAVAQIMKYYDYPSIGNGSKSYNHPDYGVLSANFGATSYQFSNMPGFLYSSNLDVAKLMYHIGVAVEMNYSSTTSGSYTVDAKNAMKNYFNYKSSIQHVSKISYTDAAWKTLMINELQNGRPVFYGGVDPNVFGGHAWVVDGYNGFDHFHINWGWDGQLNGYFMLNGLTPSGNANFTIAHEAIIGIEPANSSIKAQFTADTLIAKTNQNIQFSDLSVGNLSSWNWQFQGASPSASTQSQPGPISYSQPGSYDIKLIVGDGQTYDTIIKEDYVVITPFSDFNASKKEIAKGQSIDFMDHSQILDPVINYTWNFEGGSPSSSSVQNPQGITYNQAGIFKVSLNVQTASGSNINEKLQYIKVYEQCDTLYYSITSDDYINPSDAPGFNINEYDFDGLTPYYFGAGHHSGWNIFNEVINPGDTNFFYGSTSWFTTPGQADNWIVFGPLTIPSFGAAVFWEHMYWLNNKRDAYKVYLDENGPHPNSITSLPVFEVADNDPFTNDHLDWNPIKMEMDSIIYGGKQVYLSFHHLGNDKAYVFFDNIGVVSCSGLPNTSINQQEDLFHVSLFPNPSEDNLTIHSSENIQSIVIYDLQGRIIKKQMYDHHSHEIRLSLEKYPPGIYYMEIRTEKGKRQQSFIRQ